MSFWNRTLAALGLRRSAEVAIEGDRVVLRDLRQAKTFPQEPAKSGIKQMTACERCGSVLRQVVFTTAGGGEQLAIWREYPLAIDGWHCVGCGWSAMPRVISPEESVEYGRRGSEHAAAGEFDDAEFWFRRILGSWPGYHAGYADLGQLFAARAGASSDIDEKQRYRALAEEFLRRAVKADPDYTLPGIRIPLASTLALLGNEAEAEELVSRLLTDPSLKATERAEAEALSDGIREGKALFSRATELTRDLVLEPPRKPLTKPDRRDLERARELLVLARQRKGTFATCWVLGKVEMRLGNGEAALKSLEEAHALNPDQPDGLRELASAYLELDRAEESLPFAKRAAELRPEDVGLRCNLALVLLLTGDVQGARDEASSALSRDPSDAITRNVARMIDQVLAGRRACPRTLREAEQGHH